MTPRTLLSRAQTGHGGVREDHIRAVERIGAWIADRFGVDAQNVHAWKCKHLRWALEVGTRDMANPTRYEYWRSVRGLIAAMGRLHDWEPHLRGPWQHPDGRQPKRGQGGRPPKVATRARG